MVDIHTHILPGMDDGAIDICETIDMVRMAAECGVERIVATPHCNYPGMYDNYFGEEYINSFERVVRAVKEEGIKIQICPGMEVFATYDLPNLIVDKKIMPINQSRYILVEFAVDEEAAFANNILERMKEIGAKPIVAHAERYKFIQDNPEIVFEWRRAGYLIQNNKSSFQGKFGSKAQNAAYYMMNHYLTNVIASDAHGARYRTPNMLEVYQELQQKYTEKYLNILFNENPNRICDNRPIVNLRLVSTE